MNPYVNIIQVLKPRRRPVPAFIKVAAVGTYFFAVLLAITITL